MNIQPWQWEMLEKMTQYKGRGIVQITGRGVGKGDFSAQAFKRLMDDVWYSPVQNIVLAEGTVYGSRYYTAEPVGGNWREMEVWCSEMFGESGSIWNTSQSAENQTPIPNSRWYMNSRKFWFRDERDRMIFVLKWR